MIRNALSALPLDGVDVVFIENVGNLVCPAEFSVGEDRKVMVLSVAEGEDKPLKYPLMFRVSDLLLLNKTDLLDHLDFDVSQFRTNTARVNPMLPTIEFSARTGQGFQTWIDWLLREVAATAARGASCGGT
jgi:hydrogenase nickel incorporation protein HypB